VLITAYSHYAPVVLGLQLDKATAKLEAEGVPLAGIDVVNAPSPELVNQVYQAMPDEAGKVTLKVYAPYYHRRRRPRRRRLPRLPAVAAVLLPVLRVASDRPLEQSS
jgi:hypothetical protein